MGKHPWSTICLPEPLSEGCSLFPLVLLLLFLKIQPNTILMRLGRLPTVGRAIREPLLSWLVAYGSGAGHPGVSLWPPAAAGDNRGPGEMQPPARILFAPGTCSQPCSSGLWSLGGFGRALDPTGGQLGGCTGSPHPAWGAGEVGTPSTASPVSAEPHQG